MGIAFATSYTVIFKNNTKFFTFDLSISLPIIYILQTIIIHRIKDAYRTISYITFKSLVKAFHICNSQKRQICQIIGHSQSSSKQHYVFFQAVFFNECVNLMQIYSFICAIFLDRKRIFDGVTIYYTQIFNNQLGYWSFLLVKNWNMKTLVGLYF